ncbi:maleylpyruvate isomerase family mycothiol-dependent enzyme [Nocardioides sp. HDW12B]|uniref:maleylpyruvate isomerase family mycothiol-dependent enzyme n=1 Tax=Nocardioides sp. HDW12B TaxID=2714939 RepID=UPI0014073487|nr:maleylpyruvate isomerase family mycothiol-dependent enzyme [Nocardioides sp. HDW12B]QIK65645.1 maleylpyruvate isomerase family mycothiol-dependent enzyme [Nocardioides sp. HDW12B]
MTSREELQDATAQHRRLTADLFDDLSDDELDTATLCPAWTAHAMAAHLVMPLDVPPLRFALEIARHKGSMDRASEAVVARLADRPIGELTAVLREKADVHPPIPVVGTTGQLADTAIHLRDVARPLGRDDDVPLTSWRLVLAFLVTRAAQIGHAPRGVTPGLRFRATDQAWSWGEGAEVVGPSEAVALGIAGRPAALVDLDGPGLHTLQRRLAGRGE